MAIKARERARSDAEAAAILEDERKSGRITSRFAGYRRDSVGFITDQLGSHLWSKQREIARSIVDNRLTAVRSCHGPGKALGASEPVLTPDGWCAIGALRVGDLVIAGDGTPTAVVGVYPQGRRPLFRVSFDDGGSVRADADHLWITETRSEHRAGRGSQVRTTAEIAATLTYPNGAARGLNHRIPAAGVVQHPARDLPLDPYLFGQWLGDGAVDGHICGAEDQIALIAAIDGVRMSRAPNSPGSINVFVYGIRSPLRALGVFGLRSYEKFIPEQFLRAAPEQRLAILQGLMDTDGTVGKDGEVTFDSTSERLADGVTDLVRSFGGIVRRSSRIPKLDGQEHRRCYRVSISLPTNVCPFRLPRKLARLLPSRTHGNATRRLQRFIASVAPTGEGEAVCIAVAHPSRTYLTRDHIVTHNTFLAARIGAWWLSVHEPGDAFLLTTAPTQTQVEALLWRELNKAHAAGGLPGEISAKRWKFGDELVGIGISPDDANPAAGQGFHARFLLAIADEACGVSKTLMDNFTSVASNDESRMLAIGNPDDPSTEFGAICRPGSGWNVIGISAFDTPAYTGEPVPDSVRRVLVGKSWVEERRRRWGVDSPLWRSKVLGEFPEQSEDALVPMADLYSAVQRQLTPALEDPSVLGVDVARLGSDYSVVYHRKGPVARRVFKQMTRDTMHLVGEIVRLIRETGARKVRIDDIGVGGGVTDRLKEIQRTRETTNGVPTIMPQVEILGINVGSAASDSDGDRDTPASDERFLNLRAELNWGLRDLFVAGDIALEGDTDDLLSQAAQMKYKATSRGKIQIEAKADMKKRTKGVSPDDWDALVLACAKVNGPKVMMISDDLMNWARSSA